MLSRLLLEAIDDWMSPARLPFLMAIVYWCTSTDTFLSDTILHSQIEVKSAIDAIGLRIAKLAGN